MNLMNKRTIAILLLLSLPALAVIDVKLPLGKMYVDSKAITAAEISKIDNNILELKPPPHFKAPPPPAPDLLKIQVRDPASLLTDLTAKDASKHVAIFDGRQSAAIHIADHWYTAMPTARPGAYIITARKLDYDKAFAGTTAELLKELAKLKTQDAEPPTTAPAPPAK